MNKLLIMFSLLIFFSCNNQKKKVDNLSSNRDTVKLNNSKIIKRKNIGDFMSDSSYYHWAAKHPDTTQYLCEITFHKEYLIYWYHGQCQYYYLTNRIGPNSIGLIWSYKTDCILDMDFLEKSNGVKSYPKPKDNFATYTLINDSTIHVEYDFPDWAKRVNNMASDSIFPSYFYLQK
jgi:hypothetical protein